MDGAREPYTGITWLSDLAVLFFIFNNFKATQLPGTTFNSLDSAAGTHPQRFKTQMAVFSVTSLTSFIDWNRSQPKQKQQTFQVIQIIDTDAFWYSVFELLAAHNHYTQWNSTMVFWVHIVYSKNESFSSLWILGDTTNSREYVID